MKETFKPIIHDFLLFQNLANLNEKEIGVTSLS